METESSSDPILLVGAPLLLAGVALAVSYLPARRAMAIDPVAALREECGGLIEYGEPEQGGHRFAGSFQQGRFA